MSALDHCLQVYIVAVQRSRQKESSSLATEGSGSDSGGAGLLNLVQSDLSTLSRLWLAALQDYALLTLPQEYTPQLPATGRRQGERGGGKEGWEDFLLWLVSLLCRLILFDIWRRSPSSSSYRRFFLHGGDSEPGQSSLLFLLGSHPPCHFPLAPQHRSVLLLTPHCSLFDLINKGAWTVRCDCVLQVLWCQTIHLPTCPDRPRPPPWDTPALWAEPKVQRTSTPTDCISYWVENWFQYKTQQKSEDQRVYLFSLTLNCLVTYSSVRDQCGVPVFSTLWGPDGEHHFLSASSAGTAGRTLAPN